jgi:sulfatase maturation enzyme AslB (radical SAM superfamily)
MYFTGGEPLINSDHWNLLEELIKNNRAKDIMLVYNSNLTTLKYKDKSIVDIWAHFKKIEINCSIDAVGKTFEYIRSGADWEKVSANIDTLRQLPVSISLCPVISLLNIWHIDQLCEYADRASIKINPVVLSGPDYLALNVVPDRLKQQALTAAQAMKKHIDNNTYNHIVGLIENNINQCLFKHAMSHILLLDNLRSEKLFDLLPFKNIAQTEILENHEYESK